MICTIREELIAAGFDEHVVRHISTNISLTTEKRIKQTILIAPLLDRMGYGPFDIARVALNQTKLSENDLQRLVEVAEMVNQAVSEINHLVLDVLLDAGAIQSRIAEPEAEVSGKNKVDKKPDDSHVKGQEKRVAAKMVARKL